MQTILAVCVGKAVNHGLWLGRNTCTGAEEETANGFSDGVLARLLRWLCAHCPKSPHKGLQTNQSKWKVSALSSSLHTIQQSPPHTSSSLKYFQREVGTVEDSASPKVFNHTYVRRRTPAFFQAVDWEELLASQSSSVSMKPWELIGLNY